jgi:hypothetical protein
MFKSIASLAVLALGSIATINAQGNLDESNNVTSLSGTWSSGSGGVQTGGVSLSDHHSDLRRIVKGW